MDPLPLIPKDDSNHGVTSTLRRVFQNTLDGRFYPQDIARNILRSDVDEELKLKKNAKRVLQVYANAQGTLQMIQNAEYDIMAQKGLYMMKKDEILRNFQLKESLKLKRCDLFKALEKAFVDEFGLIQSSDLLPEIVRQYLDFRYYTSSDHVCSKCSKKEKGEVVIHLEKNKSKVRSRNIEVDADKETISNILKIFPHAVTFHNFELGQTYSKKVKIINTSPIIQAVSLKAIPSLPCFSAYLEQNSKLAPGMSVSAVVTFKPELYRNYQDEVVLKNGKGDTFSLPINCSRDLPRLITCVLKSNANLLEPKKPDNPNFSKERQRALNSSLDCGSCLVSQYNLVSVIVENKGMSGKFFIITEEEWFLQDIQTISNCMELLVGDFWIYPNFFEIDTDEIIEVNIIFQPTRPGLNIETLYVICDNNSFQQLEIMGDAVEFSRNFIKIDFLPDNIDISDVDNFCIYFGNIENKCSRNFTLTVHNKSPLYVDCLWKFRNKDLYGIHDLQENWITQKNENRSLLPYSTTDYEFEILPDASASGYHSLFISLFLLNIPLASISEFETFTVIEKRDISGNTLSEAVDVQITELEIACSIDFPVEVNDQPESMECKDRTCESLEPKLSFSNIFLHFGVIPTGLKLQKELCIQNNADEQSHWIILEVPKSWVSILVLISVKENEESKIESICVVTYEIIDYDIAINTGQTTAPILCPLKLIHVGVPIEMFFTIENRSPITGCFYFLKPTGRDCDKVSIKLTPNSSVLKSFEKMDISATLTCSEIGIFENVFVPCFVGKGQKPIMLRVLCAVDGIHVSFYLPNYENGYRKLIWPPKVVYEYDNEDWGICPCEQEDCLEYETNLDEMLSKKVVCSSKAVTVDGPEESDSSGTPNPEMNEKLEQILRNQFKDDTFLFEDIVEIHDLPIRTPKKVTVYIENMTPIETSFSIQAQNFPIDNKSEISMIDVKLKKKSEIWDELICNEYGILVFLDVENGPLPKYGSVGINIWIYANTFGIYSEEVMIEIPEIPAFSFSLLIDVVGCPIVFPMALNSLTKNPIMRFGSFPYSSRPIRRQIRISNTSCVPVHIIWNTFMGVSQESDDENFSISFDVVNYDYNPARGDLCLFNEYLGKNTESCGVASKETDIEPNSSAYIDVFLKPRYFIGKKQQMDLKWHIIGHIYVKDWYRSKLNYFYRKTGSKGEYIQLDVEATLERELLEKDEVYGDSKLIFYANDVIFKKIFLHYIRLVFRNTNRSPCEATLKTMDPFSMRSDKNELIKEKKIILKTGGCEEVIVNCFIDHEKILALSNLVYDIPESEDSDEKYTSMPQSRKSIYNTEIYCADKENKMLHIRKNLDMQYSHHIEKIPIDMYIHFPNIMVKPAVVKYDNVLLNTTRKTVVSVYNLTGCAVKFEIYKSSTAHDFYVIPHFGEIPKSTGINKQFTDIFIYFTPRECKAYHESIRIVTNIPNYFIEVPVKGTGTINEKFYINHKI
ncbi:deleted in lung and esophageal cancer protein 1 isoform X2 [Leptinotarsa decemlineata]|uniref:deleted in lung and esophageal cancer protein 1 isoform X2 n=1 Tax=Leptinotarsa decemlineata TaxID=7539 RepID=UPI003D3079E3